MLSDTKFYPQSVAIVLTTFYPKWYKGKRRSIKHTDKVRGDLALEFVRTAKKLGYQIVETRQEQTELTPRG